MISNFFIGGLLRGHILILSLKGHLLYSLKTISQDLCYSSEQCLEFLSPD